MPSTPQQKLTLTACCSAHASQDGLTATSYVLLPVLAQTFGLGYGQVGIVRAAQASALWLLELPSSFLAERFGAARLLVFGLLCAGIGYASPEAVYPFLSTAHSPIGNSTMTAIAVIATSSPN